MLVRSFLVQGTGAALAGRLAALTADAIVLCSLGAHHDLLLQAASQVTAKTKVYLTETYGILGYDEEMGQNIELMEEGRGQEYGYQGGSGGQGCLVVAFSDCVAGHDANLPSNAVSTMIIADQSGAWARIQSKAPLQFGGITKECYFIDNGRLLQMPYFWIAATTTSVGVSTFTDNAGPVVRLTDKSRAMSGSSLVTREVSIECGE